MQSWCRHVLVFEHVVLVATTVIFKIWWTTETKWEPIVLEKAVTTYIQIKKPIKLQLNETLIKTDEYMQLILN